MTAKRRQSPGAPFGTWLPRSVNWMSEPATRSRTVPEASTSCGCAYGSSVGSRVRDNWGLTASRRGARGGEVRAEGCLSLPSSDGLTFGRDPRFMTLLMRCRKEAAEREAWPACARQWRFDGLAAVQRDGDEGRQGAGQA